MPGWMAMVAAEPMGTTSGTGLPTKAARSLLRADILIVCMLVIDMAGFAQDLFIRRHGQTCCRARFAGLVRGGQLTALSRRRLALVSEGGGQLPTGITLAAPVSFASNRRGTGFAGPLAVPPGGRRRRRFGGCPFRAASRTSTSASTTRHSCHSTALSKSV